MTRDQHIKLVEVGDSFWQKLGVLAAEHVAMLPEDIEPEVIAYLQDVCSIYGTRYNEHLEKLRQNEGHMSFIVLLRQPDYLHSDWPDCYVTCEVKAKDSVLAIPAAQERCVLMFESITQANMNPEDFALVAVLSEDSKILMRGDLPY